MKKASVQKTQQQQLSDISAKLESLGDKLDDLTVLLQQQRELLIRLMPKPQWQEKTQIVAKRIGALYDTPIRQFADAPVRVDPNLGSL